MMLIALAAVLTVGPTYKASDFFPATAGLRLTYEEMSLEHSITSDVVLEQATVGGVKVTPIQTLRDAKTVGITYYRITDTEVSMVANDPKAPFPRPIPIFHVGENAKTQFAYDGASGLGRGADQVKITGSSEVKGERDVLGKKLPVLEVHTTTQLGVGRGQERIEQDSVYAKGIGLVSVRSITYVGKKSATSTVRLTHIEPPKEGG